LEITCIYQFLVAPARAVWNLSTHCCKPCQSYCL